MKVVPELLCRSLAATTAFFTTVLEFEIKYRRDEQGFAYLSREGVDLMVEQVDAPGRRWITASLQPPFGRGINFQWDVSDASAFYGRVRERAPDAIWLPLERRDYRVGERSVGQTQFVVQDPDGYLFRFCSP